MKPVIPGFCLVAVFAMGAGAGRVARLLGWTSQQSSRGFAGSRGLMLLSLAVVASLAMPGAAPASPYGVASWGWNEYGQVGDGTLINRDVPMAVVGLGGVKAISAGSGIDSLALLENGTVMAWGDNEYGELGTGNKTSSDVPVEVKGLGGVKAIAAGFYHSLALLENGTVMAWGDNEYGELGDGNTTNSDVPVEVKGLSGVTAISAGYHESLALLSNGTVVAWGRGEYGQLGNGTGEGGTQSDVPVAVSGLSTVAAISTGFTHNLALLNNGKVMAWGENARGELGDGLTSGPEVCNTGLEWSCSRTPVEVSGLSGVTALSAGNGFSVALLSNGTVKAWGEDQSGQLGNGSPAGPESCLQPLEEHTTCSTKPIEVRGLSGVTAISAGSDDVLALLSNDTVMAWGANSFGQMGDGTMTGQPSCIPFSCDPTPVEVSGLPGVTAISAGEEHNMAYGPEFPIGEPPPEPQPEEAFGEENPGEPHQGRACAGDPVSCATGNLVETQTDVNVSGRGVPLVLTRTYNAQAAVTQSSPGLFGYGWSSSFSDHLTINSGAETVTVVQNNGSSVIFKSIGGPGELTAPKWAQAKLVLNSDGTYTYTLPTQETFRFDGEGHLLSESDRSGNTTMISRSAEGRIESIADPSGRKLSFAYSAEGQVESIKDPMGHTVKYAYEAGNLVSVTEPGESTPRWRFKYDSSHRLLTMTDGRGGVTTDEYDSSNRIILQTDPAERSTTFEYGTRQTTITNKTTGSVTKEAFTAGYEPESITHGYGTASASTEIFTYNGAGELWSITNGNGHTTTYRYDSAGDKTSMVNADNNETKWTYNSVHDVLTMTTPSGEKTTYTRNSAGEPESMSRPGPSETTQTTKYTYDAHGDPESMTDPLGRARKYEYDSQGDRTSEIDPEGDKRTWQYNEDSQEIGTVSPRGNVTGGEPTKFTTKTERDAQGRPLTVTDPLGHTTKYIYDANGNLETQTDPNGNKTTYTYNADNEPIKVEEPNKTITETGYDGAGKVTSQADGNKHTTKYVRNVLEQVVEIVDPRGRKTVKEYDAAGNLTKVIDAVTRTTTNVYDPAGRLKEVSYSTGTHTVQYEYNGNGERTKMIDGTGTSSYTYDQLDRLTEYKDGHGDITKYEYDLADEQTKITYPNGKTVVRAYDKAGRLRKVTDWFEHVTTFSYDANSNLTSIVFPAGTNNEDKYAYNEADQMSEVKMAKGTETLASLVYTRDNDGQVKGTISKGLPGEEKPVYEYDANSRLTKAGTTGYEYDAANDPTKIASNTYTYNTTNELEVSTGFKYTYDGVGERTKIAPTSGAATTYGYNQAGNLISVERPKEGLTAEIKDAYAYDGDGLRASQTISAKTTYLSWDVAEALPSVLNDGTNSYIYGPGSLPIEQISSGGTVLYFHHDQQDSTRMLTGSTGKSEATATYDAYGNTTGTTGTVTTPLGYDSQYTSSDTGLVYLRARIYDPKTAQFLTVDPLNGQTHQPYAYAEDNPLNMGDPTGMCGVGSVGEALESINPLSEENCAYQGTRAAVDFVGGDASTISEVTAAAAAVLLPVAPPVAVALAAVSSATGAYASGEEAARGETLAASLDGLGSVLGGTAAAERVLSSLESLIPALGGEDAAKQTQALSEMFDRLGYAALSGSILDSLVAQKGITVTNGC